MKRILITGANSYIGTSFEKYIHERQTDEYKIDTLDMMDENWKNYDFFNYDTVFHVAGIAHADVGYVSEETKKMYYRVNCDLAYETAQKAKAEHVKQFIYMSSIIVYGESAPYGKRKVITKDTKPSPANFYGDSKLQAEIKLSSLQDDNFHIAIIRPPMIYGRGSKGNYPVLSKMARKLPIFPKISNERSILYIDNLCEFIRLLVKNNDQGIFFPQNEEYASTTEIVKNINPRINTLSILNIAVIIGSKIPGKIKDLCNKAFGNLVYEKSLSKYADNYCLIDFPSSINKTERNL